MEGTYTGADYAKVEPHSIEAEEKLLGAMLQSKEAVAEAVSKPVKESDLFLDRHKTLYRVMLHMNEMGHPVNTKTLFTYLKENGLFERVIGNDIQFLMRLVDSTPTPRDASYYADVILEKSLLRGLLHASAKVQQMCYNPEMSDAKEIADEAERAIFDITKKRMDNNFLQMSELIRSTLQDLEVRAKSKDEMRGVPSGYHDLDEKTGGFQPGDLIILAARPSMGKTSLALNIAENVSKYPRKKMGVAIFSLEMSKGQVAERLLSSESRIPLGKIRKGEIGQNNDWQKIAAASEKLYGCEIIIDDSNPLTVLELKGKARQMQTALKEKTINGKPDVVGLDLILVDYLQLLSGGNGRRNDGRAQEVAEISRGLKALAKEMNVPVIALSQLNRELENRPDKRPKLADLRESGSIEQDADLVLFLHRDYYHNKGGDKENADIGMTEDDRRAELIIGKHRNGPLGTVELHFIEYLTRFENARTPEYR